MQFGLTLLLSTFLDLTMASIPYAHSFKELANFSIVSMCANFS